MANFQKVGDIQTGINTTAIATNLATNNTQQTAINLNTSKTTTPFTISGTKVYAYSKTIGLDNESPNANLEIGNRAIGTPTIKLNGQENQAISSQLIFTDVYTHNDSASDYGAGAGIRWNSQDNRLEFIVDAQTGSLINGGYLQRHEFPSWNLPRVSVPTSFSAYNIDQSPKSIFLYASRVKIISSGLSVSPLTIPNTATNVVFLNSIESGIDNSESTGIISISSAGLYKFMLTLTLDQTGSQKDFKIEFNHTDGTRIWRSRDHLSREEGSLSYSLISVNTFKYLAVGTYRFVFECDEDGSGRIVNTSTSATTLMIEKMVLPNGYTLNSNYPAS